MKITCKLISFSILIFCCFTAVYAVEEVNIIKGVKMAYLEKNNTGESCTISCSKTNELIGKIDTITLRILLQSKTKIFLLDARTPKWDDGKRIPGALSLTSEDSVQKFDSLIPQKDVLIVVYCSNALCGASDRLIKRLIELKYSYVIKYIEGIDEWREQGNPVT